VADRRLARTHETDQHDHRHVGSLAEPRASRRWPPWSDHWNRALVAVLRTWPTRDPE
jgi:hypothetical protein